MVSKAALRLASRAVLHPWFRLRRGMTLGVRAAVIGADGRMLLVRHTYAPGWMFPGGGVERGETAYDAVRREVLEECGVTVEGVPHLHGLFSNEKHFPGDHVAFFVIRDFSRAPWKPSGEIAAADFFLPMEVPEGTTGGTRRRIAEILGDSEPGALW